MGQKKKRLVENSYVFCGQFGRKETIGCFTMRDKSSNGLNFLPFVIFGHDELRYI